MAHSNHTERWLKSEGVGFTYYAQLDIDTIDQVRSRDNQARFIPIDERLVDEYVRAKRDGAQFPALVGYRNGTGKVVLIDGNHRLAADKVIGVAFTDIYLVDSKDRLVLERLTRSANMQNGWRPSRQEVIAHIKHLVRHYGQSVTGVAKTFGVAYETANCWIQEEDVTDRLIELGHDPRGVVPTNLRRLHSLIKHDTLLWSVFDLMRSAKLTVSESDDLITAINAKTSDFDRMAVVTAWRERLAERVAQGQNGRSKWPAKAGLLGSISRIINLIERYPNPDQLGLTNPADIDRVRKDWQVCVRLMEGVLSHARELQGQG